MTPVQDPPSTPRSPARPLPLFLSALKVGAIGFGGGSALIPVVEDEFVQKRRFVDEDTFTQHVVVANVTPGALPVKLTALAATRSGSWWAPLTTAIGAALPGTAAAIAILALFSLAGPDAIRWIEFAALGITAFIVVLLIHYITKVLGSGGMLGIAIALAVFLSTGAAITARALGRLVGADWSIDPPQASAVQVILVVIACAAIAAVVGRFLPACAGGSPAPAAGAAPPADRAAPAPGTSSQRHVLIGSGAFLAVTVLVLGLGVALGSGRFIQLVALSTVSSFGGGEAYVGVADGVFVAPGMVSAGEFYGQAVPVANALPGPILVKIAAAIGFLRGVALSGTISGLALAATALLGAVCSCCAIALLFQATYEKAARSRFIRVLSAIILPAICGLLLTTIMSMLEASMTIGENHSAAAPVIGIGTVLGVVGLQLLRTRTRVPDLALIVLSGGISMLLMGFVG